MVVFPVHESGLGDRCFPFSTRFTGGSHLFNLFFHPIHGQHGIWKPFVPFRITGEWDADIF